jgi:hypothetical protein
VSPLPDGNAVAVDGLALDWDGEDLYAFPPTTIILKVLAKRRHSQCNMTLVAPLQWNRSWITPLLAAATEIPRKLVLRPDLLHQPGSRFLHEDPSSLNLHVFRLCGGYSGDRASQNRSLRDSLLLADLHFGCVLCQVESVRALV